MKERVILVLMLAWLTTINPGTATAQCNTKTTPRHTWHKSNDGTWKGKCDGQEYTYRISMGKLIQKCDAGEWTEVTDSVWFDYKGVRHCYLNNAVSSSIDGVNWSPVIGSCWLSSNGYWYRLDKNEEIWWDKFDKMEKKDY